MSRQVWHASPSPLPCSSSRHVLLCRKRGNWFATCTESTDWRGVAFWDPPVLFFCLDVKISCSAYSDFTYLSLLPAITIVEWGCLFPYPCPHFFAYLFLVGSHWPHQDVDENADMVDKPTHLIGDACKTDLVFTCRFGRLYCQHNQKKTSSSWDKREPVHVWASIYLSIYL